MVSYDTVFCFADRFSNISRTETYTRRLTILDFKVLSIKIRHTRKRTLTTVDGLYVGFSYKIIHNNNTIRTQNFMLYGIILISLSSMMKIL